MYARRLKALPPYLFAEIDKKKEETRKKGIDIIDLGVGDPDLPTPSHIIEALCEAAKDPSNHRYPSYEGLLSFREAVAEWYKKRKGVKLEAENEVLTLIGSKEGIAHAIFAFLDAGSFAIVPDPAYPVYKNATILADGIPYCVPLLPENDFKPDLWTIDKKVARKAKIMLLNYPNNPTTAVVDKSFFKEVVDFAKENDIIVFHDNPYSEITYDGYEAPSFLAVQGAKEVGIEFNSLSKTYNMTGWRIGFAVGNSEILEGLRLMKTNIDSGTFQAIQIAGIAALRGPQDCIKRNIEVYKERRDILVECLEAAGLEVKKPKATFYVWVNVPEGYSSIQFSMKLLEQGIVVTPGIGFGEKGEGYVRFSLCVDAKRIEEAGERIKKLSF
ncbi:MAG: LL-diaminopimelate aminotransferase [Candidatus Methanospirareceae archaeon]